MKRPVPMFLVASIDGLLQLCERAQIIITLQLLLAFLAGETQPTFPGRWIAFEGLWHYDQVRCELPMITLALSSFERWATR